MPDFSVITQYVVYIATAAVAILGYIKGTLSLEALLALLGGLSLGHGVASTVASKKLTKLALQVPTNAGQAAPVAPVYRDPMPPEVPNQ